MVTFAIVIVTYNRPHLLRYTLESLQAQSYREFTVHVVDNGSDPPVALDSLPGGLDLTLMRFASNRHPSDAGEAGIRHVLAHHRDSHFLLLADDDVLSPNALAIAAALFERHPDVESLGGGFTYFDHDRGVHLSSDADLSRFSGELMRFDARRLALGLCSYWGIGPAIEGGCPRLAHPSASFFSLDLLRRTQAAQGEVLIRPLGDVGFVGCCFHTDAVGYLDLPLAVLGRTAVREMNGAQPGGRAYWKHRDGPWLEYTPLKGCSFANVAVESHLKVLYRNKIDRDWDCTLRPEFFVRHLEQVLADDPETDETRADVAEAAPLLVESMIRSGLLPSTCDRQAAAARVVEHIRASVLGARRARAAAGDQQGEATGGRRFVDIVDCATWQDRMLAMPLLSRSAGM